jgi:hypothetical protein
VQLGRQKLAKLASSHRFVPGSSLGARDDDMGLGAVAATREDEEAKMEAGGDTADQKLDAGALFVLQSKGDFPRRFFCSRSPCISSVLLCFLSTSKLQRRWTSGAVVVSKVTSIIAGGYC